MTAREPNLAVKHSSSAYRCLASSIEPGIRNLLRLLEAHVSCQNSLWWIKHLRGDVCRMERLLGLSFYGASQCVAILAASRSVCCAYRCLAELNKGLVVRFRASPICFARRFGIFPFAAAKGDRERMLPPLGGASASPWRFAA